MLLFRSHSLCVIIIDRVKVVNGMCAVAPPPSSDSNINNNNNNSTNDEIENPYLLNVLNWSPIENLIIPKATTEIVSPSKRTSETGGTQANEENETKTKTGFNAVQMSIELQKKMLK
jgi:hypothetical protein